MRLRGAGAEQRDEVTALWAAGHLGKRTKGEPEVVFGQVREDAAVEVAALAACERPGVVFCIGSGGCTAFSLLIAGPARVHAVDINPAQLHLIEIKKAAFERLSYPDLLLCLSVDARPFYPDLRSSLTEAARVFWDRRPHLLALGLNQCGIIERKLKQVMRLLLPLLQGRQRLDAMFRQEDLSGQRSFYLRHWDNWRWKLLFQWGLSRPVLRLLFGPAFLAPLPADIQRLMKEQVDAAFLGSPLSENGYLWQTFLGRYPPGEKGLPIYLQPEHHSAIRAGMDRLHPVCADAAAWLAEQPPASIGFFALSNILEVTTSDYAARLAGSILHAAAPGAVVCLRSIFPPGPHDVRRQSERLTLDRELSDALALKNRSPFCRFIQVLRVNR
jgi:S-adenosylmethionine-diacylglycerol 3-amino-3-carboxypropyl transferase